MTENAAMKPGIRRTVQNLATRPCNTLSEFEECVRIQQAVWRFSDHETVPSDVFIVAVKTGGQVIGVFEGDRQVGFTLAFVAAHETEIYLHSHFAAVLPEYQGAGIGRLLKLAQREDALKRGIRLIEWTFDPLALMNGHFNLNRLGAIVRRYIPNFYGVTTSPLHGSLPTDRFVAEWWLESPRVVSRANGRESAAESPGNVRISVPRDTTELLRTGAMEAAQIQERLRTECVGKFAEGYAAIGLEFSGGEAAYILSRNFNQ
ncbi:MAG TPA: GNAT family N-acetyltransferase [Terriglobales bacterium]